LYTYFFTQGEELEKIQNLLALKILKFKKWEKMFLSQLVPHPCSK
jgi:hypothetical protein